MAATHIAFSDDSSQGRYNSLSLCTLKKEHEEALTEELKEILKVSGITEFKWANLRSAREWFAAERLVNFVFKHLHKIRIDTIIWDHQDTRHDVAQRDDNENRVRMYYHLVSCTLSKRWDEPDTVWEWTPDEQSSVDWNTLWDCLRLKRHTCVQDLFDENPDFERVSLERPVPSNSADHVFIQLADLFAGIGPYSRAYFDRYELWLQDSESQHQGSLFDFGEPKPVFSQQEQQRFKVIKLLREKCGDNKLQVSLTSSRGFRSNTPSLPINFWLYVPQRTEDKAPTRKK